MTTFYRQGFLACTGFKVVVQLVAPFLLLQSQALWAADVTQATVWS